MQDALFRQAASNSSINNAIAIQGKETKTFKASSSIRSSTPYRAALSLRPTSVRSSKSFLSSSVPSPPLRPPVPPLLPFPPLLLPVRASARSATAAARPISAARPCFPFTLPLLPCSSACVRLLLCSCRLITDVLCF
ncbi:hypothetical protein CF326_g8481 [Tilletia indica]|nr:hypothetical protein CF326_g8481 [Tilletia indica]